MGKLVRLQLRNIIHGKLIYICLALMILLGPVATFALGNAFSDIVKNTSVCNELLSVLSVGIVETVFIVLVSCSDFNDGTTKNIIARGYTKTQLLVSKYLAIFICLIIMYIITMLFTVILLFNNGMGYTNTTNYQLINHFAGIIAFAVFYTTMAFLLEKTGAALLACIFVPDFLPTLFILLNKITHVDISKFWMEHGADLFSDKPTLGNLGWSVLYYAIYTVIFIIVGIQILKRKEIK